MKRRNLLKIAAFSAMGVFALTAANAQEPLKESIATNIGGTRFVITEPVAITGIKKINYATWGSAASPTISGKLIEKAYDTLAASTLINSASFHDLTGKFALVFRGGGINFSDKVIRCKAAGAIGVIVVNNVAGDPPGMAAVPATYTAGIPVFSVSDVDGQAISDQIKAGVPVKLTLGTWNTGGTHDLGVLADYQAAPHALHMPLHQITGSAGTTAYKHYIGGAVANYGSATETGIVVTDSVMWIPASTGVASYVTNKSYTVPSISVADSIRFGFTNGSYELTPPTAKGKYEHRYSIAYSGTDDFPQDNKGVMTQTINDSTFCKGGYDYVNGRPTVSIGIRPGTATPITFVMGNLFYVKNGGYAARKVQFSLSHNTNTTVEEGVSVNANIYKWVDGKGGDKDSVIESGELVGIGTAAKVFSATDSSGKTITLPFSLFDNPSSTKDVILAGDSWYYVAVEVPQPLFIGMDATASPFTRPYAQFKNDGGIPGKLVYETSTGLAASDLPTFFTDTANIAFPFPFAGNSLRIDSAFYDRYNEVPAIALLMSKDIPTGISNVQKSIGTSNVYPNPATQGSLTVDVALNQKSNKVVYRITDMIGRTLYSEVHNNVLNEKFQMSTAKFATGNYMLMIITDNGFDTKKVTIQN